MVHVLPFYNFYLHMFDHNLAPSENSFLDSRLVFIQKGKTNADQSGNCRRHPGKTRPLNLANTDCKILSCMVACVLSIVCSSSIATLQSGGMKGQQMIDLIFTLEAKVIDFIVRNVPHSGIFALDIASAFPSLSRRYLFWVLKNMNLPKRFRRLIGSLHARSKGTICFRNLLFHSLLISTGVKQGDPCAMLLFILAYDPLIRFISAALSLIDHLILPYCDDLAVAINDVVNGWIKLLKAFWIISNVASLTMNVDKTQFLLSSSTKENDMLAITDSDPSISISQFLSAIKYLGIFVGVDCLQENWNAVLCDYIATSRFISSLDCGLMTKISLYNMLAISKLSYVASFLPPNKDALKAENRALQTLCRGPWNAIPPSLLKSVKQIGMPTQATDLTALSIASKIRVAHETSQKIFHMNSEINKIYDGFDIVLIYLDYKLANTTCIKSICNAYDSFRSSPDGNSINSGVFSQKKIYQKLSSRETPFNFHSFVSLKANRILSVSPCEVVVKKVVDSYSFASSKSFSLTFTHIRTISNHWCTRSRFGAKNRGCLFGCGNISDNIKHTCCCPSFWDAFFSVSNICAFPVNLENVVTFSNDSIPLNETQIKSILIGLHIAFLCFHDCRHGKAFSQRLVQHHMSHFMRKHKKVSSVLRGLLNPE